MVYFVLDCSVTMAWFFQSEATLFTRNLRRSLSKDYHALVPSLWPLEVTNVFLIAERRKRIKKAEIPKFVDILETLPIEIDSETANKAFNRIIALAMEHQLSSYDAAYLELAGRKGIPLATLDKQLQRAASQMGIPLLSEEKIL